MNDQKVKEKPEELIRAQQLIDDAKVNEAHDLLNNFEKKEGLTLHDKVLSHLLRTVLLLQQGRHKEVLMLAEETYDMSLGLGKNLISVDALRWMAGSLIWLNRWDKAFNIIKQGEELLKTLPQELPAEYKQREASIALVKGFFYLNKGDADRALEHLEHTLALQEELGIKHEIALSLSLMALTLCRYKGELDRALKYAERSLALAKESTKKYYIATSLNILALIYSRQGELDRALEHYEHSLALREEFNNKTFMASIFNDLSIIYKMRGELDRALEFIEQAMALNRELGGLKALANNHDFLIQILIDKGDLERAHIFLHDLEQLNSQLKDKQINLIYLFDKALVLKTSYRSRDRGKAEEIFNQLLEDKDLGYKLTIGTLLNLCELLLTELRITNDLEVLDELNQFIARLLDITAKSYWELCEMYLLQAKLSLLTFNIKKSQRFLTQAYQIAERFDLTQLTGKISNEKEDLLTKLDLWEKLKESGAPMSDRMELARLDEKVLKLIQKRTIFTVQVSEEKITVSKEKKICLVCRGEVLKFSYICECGVIYCENCARALTNLENVCWACEVPIDSLKPVKQFKEEAERIKVQEKSKKK